MTKLYLIRHAEAEGNLYRRIHGHYNSLLTDLGLLQADAVGRRFRDEKLDAVWSSDLFRAARTAEAVAAPHGLTVQKTDRLREIGMGAWEDKLWGEVEEREAETYRLYNFSPDQWHVSGSESWEGLKQRMFTVVSELARQYEGGSIAVASHGCALRALQSVILSVPGSEISRIQYCDNTAVSLLTVENGRFQFDYMNDSSHLPDELSAFRRETWWKDPSGSDRRDMCLDPYDVAREREVYLRRYREAWVLSHGSEKGFSDIYYDWAVLRSMGDARAVVQATLAGKPAGMIELAPDSGAEEGCGHIAFLCMDPDYRGRGLAVQLIGHAVSYYRALGRDRLRLRVNENNVRAVRFYTKYGFKPVKREKGIVGKVLIMEKGIRVP